MVMARVRAEVSSDPYQGLLPNYKVDSAPFPKELVFKQPGERAFPDKRTLDAPPILASVSADRKKSNASVCYTRVTPLDSHRACGETGACVFVSRHESMFTGEGNFKRSLVASLEVVNAHLARAQPYGGTDPIDDWRNVEAIRDWPLDGVLLSHRNEANASDVLNVAVQGRTRFLEPSHFCPAPLPCANLARAAAPVT